MFFGLKFGAILNKLAGVPGVVRDEKWRNLIASFFII